MTKLNKLFQSDWDTLLTSNSLADTKENGSTNTKEDLIKILASRIYSKANDLNKSYFVCSTQLDI